MKYLNLSFAKKKLIISKTKIYLIGFAILLVLLLDIPLVIRYSLDAKRWHSVTLAAVLFSLPLLWGFWKIAQRIEKKMDAKMDIYMHDWEVAEQGDDGEIAVYQDLKKILDGNYQIHRNVILPGLRSDLDIVIVGPKGIFLCEVKNYKKTRVIFDSRQQYYCSQYGDFEVDPDLRRQMTWRADKLERYLAENGLYDVWPRKVIVYVNPESVEIKEFGGNENRVYIARGMEVFEKYLSTSAPDKRFNEEFCAKVNEILVKVRKSQAFISVMNPLKA